MKPVGLIATSQWVLAIAAQPSQSDTVCQIAKIQIGFFAEAAFFGK